MRGKVSLLDLTAGQRLFEWWVVYYPRVPYFFWAAWFKQGFRHVELWRPYQFGSCVTDVVWLRLTPTFELLEASIDLDPMPPWVRFPGVTVQKVQVLSKAYKMREWFSFGPPSCTETVKNALGISRFWLRSPYQLYKFIRRHDGVLGVT